MISSEANDGGRLGHRMKPYLIGAVSLLALSAGAREALAQPASDEPGRAAAAEAAAAEADDEELSELVVTASALPQQGAALVDVKPELQLNPAQIQSYGVSTITELLDELAPQTRSDAGRGGQSTVVLLNGRRITGFAEIRDIPTEAVLRVDILPEEAALRYGYSPDQRVVNIVLRRRFRALTAEATGGAATEGGQATGQLELTETRIRGDNRMNISVEASKTTALTEAERGITAPAGLLPYDLVGNVTAAGPGEVDPALSALVGRPVTVAGVPADAAGRLSLSDFAATANAPNVSQVGRYRSLRPETQEVSLNGVLSRALSHGISATVNATLGATTSDSDQGLPGLSLAVSPGSPFSPFSQPVRVNRYVDALGPLQQSIDGWTAHLGGGLNKDFGRWRSSLTATYDHADTLTVSGVGLDAAGLQTLLDAGDTGFNPFGPLPEGGLGWRAPNKARSLTDTAVVQAQTAGPLFRAPAGQANLSLKVGNSYSAVDSRSNRLGVDQVLDLSRNDLNARASLDLPIASRSAGVLPWLGDLSINGNAGVNEVSDAGTLTAFGYGLRWTPVTGLRLLVTQTHDQQAPAAAQLAGPVVVTEGARVFDFRTGRTVDVTRVTGGNPALLNDKRDTLRINLNWKPFSKEDLSLVATYIDTRIRNPSLNISSSLEMEQAFPDRFIRAEDGDLARIDARPVNFARQDRRSLRWGFNFSHTVGKPPPPPTPEQREAIRRRFEEARARRQQTQAAPGDASRGQTPDAPQPARQGQQRPGQAAQEDGPPEGPPPGAGPDGPPPGGFGGPGGPGGGFRGGGFGGGPRGFGGGPNGQGRVQFAVYHTVIFEDELLVRPGGPVIDRLDGQGGGEAQHEIEVQAGYSARGLGARISGSWKSAYTVRAGQQSSTGDLDFSSLTTVNLRLFANLAGMPGFVRDHPWARGSRITLSVNNLFNQRIDVRDASGSTPLGYQPAYLDPVGRSVRLSVRKLFF